MTASISARTIDALNAIAAAYTKAGNDIAAALRETGRTEEAQIAAQEPAGATQVGSGDSRTSDTLSARLRAAADYQDRPGAYDELRAMADEVDEVEAAYRVADAEIARLSMFHDHYRAQVEAIRAAITREAAHGDAITRCNLVAERFRTVLDSVTENEEGS